MHTKAERVPQIKTSLPSVKSDTLLLSNGSRDGVVGGRGSDETETETSES